MDITANSFNALPDILIGESFERIILIYISAKVVHAAERNNN
jgi:hypothetical protein